MMTMIVVLALLSGWLVTELKDFFSNGGVTNTLAFGLLKMIVIVVMILIFSAIIAGSHVIGNMFKQIFYNETPGNPEKHKNGLSLLNSPKSTCRQPVYANGGRLLNSS